MNSKEENTSSINNETNANENAAKEQATSVLPNSSNADELNDVNNLNTPAIKTTTKKKYKAKGRNVDGVPDLDSELKKLSHRRINVAGAPKMPLNSYVRFMNDRREELRREYPNRTALEHTKMIGEEWHQLSEERKTFYMEAAAKDKALYLEQMHKFLKEHPEIVANELAKAKKVLDIKNTSTPKEKASNNNSSGSSICNNHEILNAAPKKSNVKTNINKQQQQQSTPTPDPDDIPLAQVKRTPTPPPSFNSCNLQPRPYAAGEIPIYTHEFIEHNRSTENELRTLRKNKTDLEQQNAVLEQHVDNTKAGHAKVMGDVSELKEENTRLAAYIKNLRQKIVSALDGIALPPVYASGLSVDNVDKYIHHLAGMISSTSSDGEQQQLNNAMLLKVGDLLSKMDTTSLLKP